MVSLRLALPAVLVAAALAGCFTYFVTPSPPLETDQRLLPTSPDMSGSDTVTPTSVDRRPSAEEQAAAAAFQRSAAAILRRLPDAQAAAGTVELPITGHIPLPKRRPIPR
jgi:hypothetical protein